MSTARLALSLAQPRNEVTAQDMKPPASEGLPGVTGRIMLSPGKSEPARNALEEAERTRRPRANG